MKKIPSIKEQHQQWCVHYRAPDHYNTCEKGVNYRDLALANERGTFGWILRLPCIRNHHKEEERRGQPLMFCKDLQWPTMEESEEHERKVNEHTERTVKARIAIVEHSNGERGVQGKFQCPVCKEGTLMYTIASYNGHIHAACTTKDCVRWME